MNDLLFISYASVSAGGLLLALGLVPLPGSWSARSGDTRRQRRMLHGAACAILLPLVLKGLFCVLPRLEADVMPIAGYAPVQRDFFLPFGVLFFAVASHLVPGRNRRALLALTIFVALLSAHLSWWRLGTPVAYSFDGTVDEKGVCFQGSGYTCAAASMVVLLDQLGIETTEGEMAKLSGTIPDRGASFFQVAHGLNTKLESLGRSESASLLTPDPSELGSLGAPFLTSRKLSFFIDHMFCVLAMDEDTVTIADPLLGRVVQSRARFLEDWLGIVVVVSR